MPIPKPSDEETEKEFIKRCMSDAVMLEEYPDNDIRAGVCYTAWRDSKGGNIMEHKATLVELKEEKEGSFTARIATLNVIDEDGDITKPGAFPKNKTVIVSAYQHGSWMGELPVGKAVIREQGDEVLADGQFNLNTVTGREHYQTAKFSPELVQWSYGYEVKEWEHSEIDGNKVRIIKKVEPFEISPVILGAGVNTGLVAIKAQPQDKGELQKEPPEFHSEGITYLNQAETALAAVIDLIDRTKSLADLRRKEGRILSTANRQRMKELLGALTLVASDLQKLLDATEPDADKALRSYLLGLKEKVKFYKGEIGH